jgi:O-methyltransferase
MGVPYFPRIIRSRAARQQMPLSKQSQEWLSYVTGKIKRPIRRSISRVTVDVLEQAIELACFRKLNGDYAEFGVFTGRSIILAHYYFRERNGNPRLFAFDSFEGLPKLEAADIVRYRDYAEGTMCCSVEEFLDNCKQYNVPLDRVVPVKGWFNKVCNQETATRVGLDKIAVSLLDCDIQSSTLDALRFTGNHIEDGGVIIFDDWNDYRGHPQLGQRGAFAQWTSERPDLIITPVHEAPQGKASFSVHYRLTEEELRARQQ